ncbi:hypothetical protein HYT26_03290 [Candidatus Pacearchaeota archaeon]|nr:hypothetical protein [Candidatus Pacearchaeota archaeon]
MKKIIVGVIIAIALLIVIRAIFVALKLLWALLPLIIISTVVYFIWRQMKKKS